MAPVAEEHIADGGEPGPPAGTHERRANWRDRRQLPED
jgi:hypothetical protein